MFSTFPSGRAGFALFALRVLSAFVSVQPQLSSKTASVGTPGIISILAAGFLTLGLLTPYSLFFCISASAFTLMAQQHQGFGVLIIPATLCLISSLLGPGAFSFDAMIRGRRVVYVSPGAKGRPRYTSRSPLSKPSKDDHDFYS